MNRYTAADTTEKRQESAESELSSFRVFAKGKKQVLRQTGNCVIYTRVSTKEQADNNLSLETQRKACEQYALKNKYQILGYFGGTYESAKTDERRHFNAMLAFVKRSRDKISHIIVYSVDRFSRSGANAIYIAEQLKREGITVFSVSQPTDTTTASGSLQQNIQFIFSEYDNQLRREKCMAGVKETLLNGVWCSAPPLGYDILRKNGKKEFVLNSTGKLIRRAFKWKAEGMSSEAVREKLCGQGLELPNQRISDMLRNPFYCGLLVHSALDGQVVEGIQEKAVSRELFLQVNGILSKKHKSGYNLNPENEHIPLKRFLKCDNCGRYLRAYKAYKNQQYYYKCGTVGCGCNKRASMLHKDFLTILSSYQIQVSEELRQLVMAQVGYNYNRLHKDKQENRQRMSMQVNELTKKIDRLEERYIAEEIDRDMFQRYREKFRMQRKEAEEKLALSSNHVSNLKPVLDKAMILSSKLTSLWSSSDYSEKQKLQNLVFPEGITYNRKNDQCRTPRVNSIFAQITLLAKVCSENKNGDTPVLDCVPASVEVTGVEPVTFFPNAFGTANALSN